MQWGRAHYEDLGNDTTHARTIPFDVDDRRQRGALHSGGLLRLLHGLPQSLLH